MTERLSTFGSGQRVRLARAVIDDETGYHFPVGTPAQFSESLGGKFCLVILDKSLGDSTDSGTADVMVRYDDIESA